MPNTLKQQYGTMLQDQQDIQQQYGRERSTIIPQEFQQRRNMPAVQQRRNMPAVPAEARGARKAKNRKNVLASLLSKAIVGTAAAGEGIIPYGRVPVQIRQALTRAFKEQGIPEQPIVGWDPQQLSARDRAVLARLVAMGEGFEGKML